MIHKTKMMKVKEKKPVFAIVTLANSEEQMRNTIRYSADLAKHLGLDLVLHPRHEGTDYSFNDGGVLLTAMARNMSIPCTISRQAPNFFLSINRVAQKHNAAFMVVGVSGKITNKAHKKEFSSTMWEAANNTQIPIFLVPKDTSFDPFSEITIAVDASRNIQKVNFLNGLATKDTVVNLFVEKTRDPFKQKNIDTTLEQIILYLSRHDINYKIVIAREEEHYTKHLLRFAAKRSELLLIEVQSSIDSDLKENLQTVLFSKHQDFAVMLMRTKDVTLSNWR